MNSKHIFSCIIKLQQFVVRRVIWPYSIKEDSLYRWRANILSSILIGTLILGSISYIASFKLIFTKNLWHLAIIDTLGIMLCLLLIFVRKISFHIRAAFVLIGFYVVGITVILNVGPLSGGPAWLFAFAVLSGVLMGNKAALIAILMNAGFMITAGALFKMGYLLTTFQGFNSFPLILSTGANFIVLNGISAISVSAMLKGVFETYKHKEVVANNLKKERHQLIKKQNSLKSEIIKKDLVEKEIWKLSQFRNSIIENASIWLSVIDKAGNIIIWNKAAESISGYSKELVVGHRKILNWLYPDKKYRLQTIKKASDAVYRNEVLDDYSTVILRSNGEERIVSWSVRNLFNEDEVIGSMALGRDITEQTLAEKGKLEAQEVAGKHRELALVGQIAGKMAHDFNNVLGIIMGNTEIALEDCVDSNIESKLKLILNQTLSGRNLTKNLVTFAKNQEPKQEFFLIKDKIDLVISLLKKDLNGIKIIREDQKNISELLADPGMIEHALVNLIQNSIHAIAKEKEPKITIRTYEYLDNVYLEIEDNGCGIPGEHLGHIYTPSFTLKGSHDATLSYDSNIKGTGYGMANVKKYMDQHKAKISVKSEVNKFTKFTITLPVIKKELTNNEKAELQKDRKHFNKRILIVEDELDLSNVQKRILTDQPLNHKVDVATNGKSAIDLLKRKSFDFVSLDYILTGDLNGMDVYNQIRKISKDIPILFLSGNIEFLESVKELKENDKRLDHLSKPCQNKVYINSINRLFDI